ncbi:MAG: leucyl aminopeptidase [Planctomycetales bacterium]
MNIVCSGAPWSSVSADWLIVPLPEQFALSGPVAALNESLGGLLGRLREGEDFTGKLAETVAIPAPSGIAARRLFLVGLGVSDKLTEAAWYRAAMTAVRSVSSKKSPRVAVALPLDQMPQVPAARVVQALTCALHVGSSGQDLFRTEKKRFPLEQVELLVSPQSQTAALQSSIDAGTIVGEAINLTREMVNLPAALMYPESFADRAQELARQHQIDCQVLDQPALEKERMGSLLAVAAGSDRSPRLVAMEYYGAPPGSPLLALVGKGVTFDSGGLSIKPTDGMLTMKCDMAGAATVLAATVAITRLKLPVRVLGLMGLVENMTGGSAMKLGDVLTARSGVTIEVQNTDAEGRLVLADVLDYAVSRGADRIVDLATLTGACVVALGEEVVGAMTNDQGWCDQVLDSARTAGEEMWQLPMFSHYDELIKSEVADIRNVGGRWGGAITAGKFLERFVRQRPWVHLDIAGPAFASSDKPHRDGGGTGCMVRTLVELARRSNP